MQSITKLLIHPRSIRPLLALAFFASVVANKAAHADVQANPMTANQAQAFITPLYAALTADSASEVSEKLRSITAPQWVSCASNQSCQDRDAVIARWSKGVSLIPDMAWTFKEVLVVDNKIIVRGEGTGTPTGEFLGVPVSGKSFRLMAIDIHTLEQGRVISTYHVEDWLGVTQQLQKD